MWVFGKAEVKIRSGFKKVETCVTTYLDGLGLSLGLHDKLQAAERRKNTNGL